MLKRTLVLSTESARHPFRRSLPAHVLRWEEPEAKAAVGKMPATRNDDQDWKLFALSFSAFFTAFYSFIA
ncbi:hypothetical protein GGR44_001185 [Sphingobium fontiphilum]|uniref:Uncharacterized protein n=1 Tax=Sphingobium fontiphilum TaxID=944425 RepID=A0A7W6DKK8_9SPHN|nr:hypothetical protein [Sphingobium fontiphilum]MBB3981538.1 hypothetical protein [Sphingobium fontiphilum]